MLAYIIISIILIVIVVLIFLYGRQLDDHFSELYNRTMKLSQIGKVVITMTVLPDNTITFAIGTPPNFITAAKYLYNKSSSNGVILMNPVQTLVSNVGAGVPTGKLYFTRTAAGQWNVNTGTTTVTLTSI